MPEPSSSLTALLLILCSLSTIALAFNPTLEASYFYMSAQQNYLAFELDQTRNGIIAFSVEAADSSYLSQQTVSQYVLIDIPNRDAKAILTDLVSACEDINVTPTFPNLHYHIQTDTLAYFCSANNSLLLIDQSNYQVQTVIPLSISGSWPVAKLSTEGMGLAILLMGDLLATTSQASLLVKVDLQTRQVTAAIPLNQGFSAGETVVAYTSNKKGAYIATNRVQGENLVTKVYSFITIGKQYQITAITSFKASMGYVKTITKLFCLETYLAVNNGKDLYFINQKGAIATQVKGLAFRSSNSKSTNFYDLAMTSQPESTYLYLRTDSVYKYSVLAGSIHSQKLGDFNDMKIAYGNSTSGDLMFTLGLNSDNFTIYDVQTMKPIYFAPVAFSDHMLTDSTYVVVYNDAYIFDIKSNQVIATPRAANEIYHTKEQHIISQMLLELTVKCHLQHTDLTTGKSWITLNFTAPDYDCGSFDKLRLTEKGNPEFIVHQQITSYFIDTETYGQLTFDTTGNDIKRGVNYDFDNLSFYMLSSSTTKNQTNITSYAFNPQTKKFEYRDSNLLSGISGEVFAFVNTTQSVIISDNALVVINGLGTNPEKYLFPQDWNSASTFQDPAGNNYVILSKYKITSFDMASVPGLFVNGNIINLPGTRKQSARAKAAGVNSYWVADRLGTSLGAVRFYKVDGSNKNGEKIKISL